MMTIFLLSEIKKKLYCGQNHTRTKTNVVDVFIFFCFRKLPKYQKEKICILIKILPSPKQMGEMFSFFFCFKKLQKNQKIKKK